MSDNVEDVCRLHVAESERRYKEATQAYTEAVESGEDARTITAAEERRNATREEFHQALRVFSDMVIRGKVPREPAC